MKKIVLASLLVLVCFAVDAQVEQVYKPVILQIETGNGIKEYVGANFGQSITSGYPDSSGVVNREVSINLSLETVDGEFMKWVADSGMEKDGKILLKDKKTGKAVGEMSFKGATINSFYSSYSDVSSYYSYEQNNSITIGISVKEYIIDGIKIKTGN